MEHKSFSVPFTGDEQACVRALTAMLAAWQRQYPAVRVLDTLFTIGRDAYALTISYDVPTGAHRVTV